MTRSDRTLMRSGCCDALRGTGPRATGAGVRFFATPVGPDRLIRTCPQAPCSSRAPALEPFVIRRSKTTERRRGDSD